MNNEIKKCIGIIFGGLSNEHDISIASTKAIFEAFNSVSNRQKFNVNDIIEWQNEIQN